MYRKYSLNKTHVIDKHNYMLEAQDIDSNAFCLVHQILLPDELPSLHDQRAIQNFISDSENQNLIAETRDQYEFYLDQHLLQIRFRTSIALITQLSTRPIASILAVVQALNLDFAIASKQLAANSRQRLSNSGLNNACRFYSLLMCKGEWKECILPFLDGDRLHYYDLHFGGRFSHKEEPISLPRSRLGISNIQSRIKKEESQADIFGRYVYFLTLLLSSNNFVELFGELKQLNKQNIENDKILSRVEKMMNSFQGKTQRALFELLSNCVQNPQEYSLSIFNKQCEIIVERLKHYTLAPKQITQTTVGNFMKPDRLKQSKSCLQLKPEVQQKSKPTSYARLKSSKSQINLAGKVRKSKKMPLGLFRTKDSPTSSNIFQQTWKSTFKQNKIGITGSGSPAFGKNKFNTANSQWFNASEVDSFQKLRNFKKSNHYSSVTNSPQREGSFLAEDKISEEDQSRFLRLQCKAKNQKNEKIDQFTMTEHSQEAEITKEKSKHIYQENGQDEKNPPKLNEEKKKVQTFKKGEKSIDNSRCLLSKKEIINTISIKYYEENKINKEHQKSLIEEKDEKSLKQNRKSIKINTAINQPKPCVFRAESPKKSILANNKSQLGLENKEKISQSQINNKIKMQNRSTIYSGIEEVEEIQLGKTNQISNYHTDNAFSVEISQPYTFQQPSSPILELTSAEFQASNQQECKFLETVLRFYKENQLQRASSSSGISNSLTYLLNLFYLRAVLESRTLESDTSLSGLVSLLQKKQLKLSTDYSKALTPEISSLWKLSRPINNVYRQIANNWMSFSTSKKRMECRDELEQFMDICDVGGRLLQQLLLHLAAQVQSAKPILIQSGLYLAALHFHQLLAIIIVITLQKARFYQQLLMGDFGSLTSCCKLRLQRGGQAEITEYRKKLQEKQLLYVNAVEQATFLQSWMAQYLT